MKKVMKSVMLFTMAIIISTNVFGADLVLKSFDVSGNRLSVIGEVPNAGEQVNLVISGDTGYEGIYQSVSGANGEFNFFVEAESGWNKNYTATVSSENSGEEAVSFMGDGSYVTYEETAEPTPQKGETSVSGIAYGNRIKVNGQLDTTKVSDKNVTLVIYKRSAGAEPKPEDIAYIGQERADEKGEFTFNFGIFDDIRFYKASLFAGGENISEYIKTAKMGSEYITAEISLETVKEGEVSPAKMYAELENLGSEDCDYMLIITVYDINGMLMDVIQSDKKTLMSGETASETLTLSKIPHEAVTVKAMLWSVGETVIPLDSAAVINL